MAMTVEIAGRLKQLFGRRSGELLRQYAGLSESSPLVIEDLARLCRLDQPLFDSDVAVMAFHEGRRSVILHILEMQHIDGKSAAALIADIQREDERMQYEHGN